MLVAQRFDTISGRLTYLYTAEPAIRTQWMLVRVPDKTVAKTLPAWWNAMSARLMLLNRRGQKQTYPTVPLSPLREIQIPKHDSPTWNAVAAVYDEVRNLELRPMQESEKCVASKVIEEGAALRLVSSRTSSQTGAINWRRGTQSRTPALLDDGQGHVGRMDRQRRQPAGDKYVQFHTGIPQRDFVYFASVGVPLRPDRVVHLLLTYPTVSANSIDL